MSFKKWQYAFTNGTPPEQQQVAYEQYAIPEFCSGQLRQHYARIP